MNIKELIPDEIFKQISDHITRETTNTNDSWESNKDNEDSLTGALGERLSKNWCTPIQIYEQEWEWRITYKKFSSVKLEPKYGADGLFEVEVINSKKNQAYRKGIIFQAKKDNNKDRKKLIEQVIKMENIAPNGSAVIKYGPEKYQATEGTSILNNTESPFEDLSKFLSGKFLSCTVGINGMSYNALTKELIRPSMTNFLLIHTNVYIAHRIKIKISTK